MLPILRNKDDYQTNNGNLHNSFTEDVIALSLRAPQRPGRYSAHFRLFCDGCFIGERLSADIISYEEEPGWQVLGGECSVSLSI